VGAVEMIIDDDDYDHSGAGTNLKVLGAPVRLESWGHRSGTPLFWL